MVESPSKSILKLNGKNEVFHIEVDTETTSKALTSTDDLTGFELEYTCPDCLSRNESKFTSFPNEVSVFCSHCEKSYQIYKVPEEDLVLMNTKLDELLDGVRELCGKTQIREVVEKGDMSISMSLLIGTADRFLNKLHWILLSFGLIVSVAGYYMPVNTVYFGILGLFLTLSGIVYSYNRNYYEDAIKSQLVDIIRSRYQYKISPEILDKRYTKNFLIWRFLN